METVSFRRLLWVGPLTVVVAVLLNYAIKLAVQAADPSLDRMGQLGPPLLSLTLQGAVAAVVVFVLMARFVPRPITWFRRLAIVALLVSILPDLALGMGGSTALMGMRAMGPFLSVDIPGLGGPPGPPPGGGRPPGGGQPGGGPPGAGGPPGGGPPGGGPRPGFVFPAMPPEQVVILVGLHAATALVCVLLLTTLTRERGSAALAGPGPAREATPASE